MGLEYLHSRKIYHLHLSSKNIFLDDNLTPFIADFGFNYLKDISSVFIKYKNKNSYSSPEILKETRSINYSISEEFQKSDVFSFGILLWELFTNTQPFNVSLTNLYNYVVVNGLRPEITKDFPSELANLIRICWDEDSKKRPDFKEILQILATIVNK